MGKAEDGQVFRRAPLGTGMQKIITFAWPPVTSFDTMIVVRRAPSGTYRAG
jgi:hypothetical protein